MPVTSAKLQCETQLRLIYFDFKFLSFTLAVAKTLSEFHPVAINLEVIKDSLIAIKPQYSAIKAVIDARQEPSTRQEEQLKKHSETLQKILEKTQQYRQQLCRYIQFFVNLENCTFDDTQVTNFLLTLQPIKRLWIDVNNQMNDIVRMTQELGLPAEKDKQAFEKNLVKTQKKITDTLTPFQDVSMQLQATFQAQLLKSFLNPLHSNAYRQMARIMILEQWLTEIRKIAPRMMSLPKDLNLTLHIKKLLSQIKLQFFVTFYQGINQHQPLIQQKLCQGFFAEVDSPAVADAHHFVEQLNHQEQALRTKITKLEQRLQHYHLSDNLVSGGIRLWSENYYYHFSKDFFTLIEEMTEAGAFQNTPILNVRLEEHYRSFFTLLASIALLLADSSLYGQFGVAYVTLNALSQLLLANYLLPTSARLHIDEGRAVANMSILKWAIGLGLHLMVFMALSGFSVEIAIILALSYTLATAARSLSGSVMNLAEARLFDNTNQLASHTRNLFLKPWLQQLAYICGYRLGGRVYHSGVSFFTPTPSAQILLADPKLCAEHRKACHEAALKTLELPTDTPAQEINIHSAFHRLSKKYHPDKVSGEDSHHAHEKFIDIRNARDRMEESLRRH